MTRIKYKLLDLVRNKCLFILGISIGSNELNDPSLITLKDAPMDEVRRRNEPKLNKKARILKELVLNLIRQNKMVRFLGYIK